MIVQCNILTFLETQTDDSTHDTSTRLDDITNVNLHIRVFGIRIQSTLAGV